MATLYGGTESPPIPYPGLAETIFAAQQLLIPFLGAGASLAGGVDATAPPAYPPQSLIEEICGRLGFTGKAKAYLEEAIRTASELQEYEKQPALAYAHAVGKPFPPSAHELAVALAAKASYWGSWPFSLLDVASYHEFFFRRARHWERLKELFDNKQSPLPTHDLVARAAGYYLRKAVRRDYLLITTNYDHLIEKAFDSHAVPHCVLTVDRNDKYVDVAFSDSARDWLKYSNEEFADFCGEHENKYPENFTFSQRPKPVAVLYKIHGSLYPRKPGRDSIILSDEDYIGFLKRQGEAGDGIIPAAAKNLMQRKGFLFLGHSFSDWNVRGLYSTVVSQRDKAEGDYAVVNRLNPYESQYFSQRSIDILITDLLEFVNQLKNNAPPGAWD